MLVSSDMFLHCTILSLNELLEYDVLFVEMPGTFILDTCSNVHSVLF